MITELRKKTINGRDIEYLDVIHYKTRTKFKMWDRIKILFGKEVVTYSELYTGHEKCIIVSSSAKCYVPEFFPKKRNSYDGGSFNVKQK